MNHRERITIDSPIRSGTLCIRGTRITVADVNDHLCGRISISEVLDDIQACLAFAATRTL